MSSILARRLRACALWNDEAGANAWNEHRHDEAARLWAQAKRLHAQADAAEIAEAA
ncbi:hypothetical protein MPPM_4825 [Methylorubrum populi]|uniref:Uncharacterized protein n=1 Tax=Methylorubrum populi TaxID=223967 RepID=A0A160PN02_9HYPH|nr:hypothetical protein [Methylorubrum populi]BAU93430.1 hypothetical protein MPPM_4825 [Methylorubrum populi]